MSTVSHVSPSEVSALDKETATKLTIAALRSPSYNIRYLEVDYRHLVTYPKVRDALASFGYVRNSGKAWDFTAAGRRASAYDCYGITNNLGQKSPSCRAFNVAKLRLGRLAFASVSSRGAETDGSTEYHFHAQVIPDTPLGKKLATNGVLFCGKDEPDGSVRQNRWLGAATDGDIELIVDVDSPLQARPEIACPELK